MYGSGLESATSKVACSLERQQGGGWHDCWAPRPGAPWLLLPLLALGCSWAVASSAPASSLCGKAPALSAGHQAMEAGRVRGSRGNPLVLWVLLHSYGFWFLCPPLHMLSFFLRLVFLSCIHSRPPADARAMSFVPTSIMESAPSSTVQGHSEWLCPAGVCKS